MSTVVPVSTQVLPLETLKALPQPYLFYTLGRGTKSEEVIQALSEMDQKLCCWIFNVSEAMEGVFQRWIDKGGDPTASVAIFDGGRCGRVFSFLYGEIPHHKRWFPEWKWPGTPWGWPIGPYCKPEFCARYGLAVFRDRFVSQVSMGKFPWGDPSKNETEFLMTDKYPESDWRPQRLAKREARLYPRFCCDGWGIR